MKGYELRARRFARDRDRAFTRAVMQDDWDGVRRFCRRWSLPIPKERVILEAGVYKAVQECTRIPQNVKDCARARCMALGFKPYVWPEGTRTVTLPPLKTS